MQCVACLADGFGRLGRAGKQQGPGAPCLASNLPVPPSHHPCPCPAGKTIAPVAPACLQQLSTQLLAVCKNPTQPGFNHYLFESVAALVRCLAGVVVYRRLWLWWWGGGVMRRCG